MAMQPAEVWSPGLPVAPQRLCHSKPPKSVNQVTEEQRPHRHRTKGRGKGEDGTKETYRAHHADAKNSSNTLQRHDFHVGPPRGFEPRTYALRDIFPPSWL
jgi:hypothetical protein